MSNESQSPLAQIWNRSLVDTDFRNRLLETPRATLEAELGVVLPDGMSIRVIENTPTEYTIVLPMSPDAATEFAEVSGFGGNEYHIPEHNFRADLRLDAVKANLGSLGFGTNPYPRSTNNPAAPGV